MGKTYTMGSGLSIDLVITGGGTGGHVYPGIAVARDIRRHSPLSSLLFMGAATGVEAKIVPYEGFVFEPIIPWSFDNTGWHDKLKGLFVLPYVVSRSIKRLRALQPDVVFGIGGYVSVAVVYAAYVLHIPTVLLEPNRQPNLATRLLGKSVDKIAIGCQEAAQFFPLEKVALTGHPIRKEFFLVGETPPPDKGAKFNILVIGGSYGATAINQAVIEALDSLASYRERLIFTHQTGNDDCGYVKAGYQQRQFRAEVVAYIEDLPKMYAKSHLVICRAGASIVAELSASRRPAIMIPDPHGDRHQEVNARALEETGLATVILQPQLSGESLSRAIIHSLEHPEDFALVWPRTILPNKEDAARQLVNLCFQVATGKDPYESGF